ncbi:membrane-bound PQQ-dependent dehydrogenase, glucose/quinate/shikimate family [Pseudomonas sp. MYb185]|uniref:membrane-bound PQQ-dependent dehydrogenase, glucose/quinate/shikimate family n=1 Tax=Pseudomonas sp. MYb185 TaxID=1848729 RepID=UPI000CFC8FD2|nr:membrane-bound PQQ-dependent dehydrogenase, glucose/quinate/shikimate family [Pseudomonas sp. MYb185]
MRSTFNNELKGATLLKAFTVIVGLACALVGLVLALGGGYLVTLGGSWYYLPAGVAILVAGILIARGRTSGALLFALVFLLSAVWAIWDAGFEFWPLVSRLYMLAVMGLVIAFIYPSMVRRTGELPGRSAVVVPVIMLVGVVATFAAMFIPMNSQLATRDPVRTPLADGVEQADWMHWGNTTHGDRFAALDQITPENVTQLEVAWTFRTGELPESTGSGAEDQNTPLQVGDTLYYCNAYGKVFALDVDAGEQRWMFDPEGHAPVWQRCRGLGYFAEEGASTLAGETGDSPAASCQRRLFLPTGDARLLAINAETGELCADFGDNGTVDLKVDMGEVKDGFYQQTSTPLVAGELVVVGGRVADNFYVGEPPGVVRAYDVRSGDLVWAWDPGNPDTTRRPPAGETYTLGTPNVWSAMSYDAELGLIYLPTGNTTPDFWAGQRTELDDLYSSSLVAVEAQTGRVRWHYQMTHHDIWDFDLPAQPLLYDIPDEQGGSVPAVAQVTKQGEIFLLNRVTGEPIAEVEERPVPAGNLEGERYAPTQPFSVGMPSIGNETLVESDMWGATLLDQLVCRIQFAGMRHEGVYTPPGLDRALQYPGSLGGMNWGSVAVDPTTSYMFVNDMRLGLANYMLPREDIPADASGIEMGIVPMEGTPYGAMRERFLSPLGIPCQKPPFGTMSAIDLKTRELVWQVPVGTVRDTGPMGIKMRLPIPVGMPTLGPSLATETGLLFFAGTQDYYLRAFDSYTGREIWKSRLPVGSQAGPMTYVSPHSGKQYIVITAGGARVSPDRGDYVIAYALPD